MVNKFKTRYTNLESPIANMFTITPSDSADLPFITRAIYVGGDGNIKLTTLGNETVTMTGVKGGVIYPIRVKRVFDSDTSATDLLGLY